MQRREMAGHTRRRRSPTAVPDEMACVATCPRGGLLIADPCLREEGSTNRIAGRDPVWDCATRCRRDLSCSAPARPNHLLYRPCQASRLSWGGCHMGGKHRRNIRCGSSNVSWHEECNNSSTSGYVLGHYCTNCVPLGRYTLEKHICQRDVATSQIRQAPQCCSIGHGSLGYLANVEVIGQCAWMQVTPSCAIVRPATRLGCSRLRWRPVSSWLLIRMQCQELCPDVCAGNASRSEEGITLCVLWTTKAPNARHSGWFPDEG